MDEAQQRMNKRFQPIIDACARVHELAPVDLEQALSARRDALRLLDSTLLEILNDIRSGKEKDFHRETTQRFFQFLRKQIADVGEGGGLDFDAMERAVNLGQPDDMS